MVFASSRQCELTREPDLKSDEKDDRVPGR